MHRHSCVQVTLQDKIDVPDIQAFRVATSEEHGVLLAGIEALSVGLRSGRGDVSSGSPVKGDRQRQAVLYLRFAKACRSKILCTYRLRPKRDSRGLRFAMSCQGRGPTADVFVVPALITCCLWPRWMRSASRFSPICVACGDDVQFCGAFQSCPAVQWSSARVP